MRPGASAPGRYSRYVLDGSSTATGSLGALLSSAGVRSVSIAGLPDHRRSLALELAAHATLVADDAGADAAAIAGGSSVDETDRMLTMAAGSHLGLVIVLDPQRHARAGVERWASHNDGWLLLDEPPIGTEVLVPAATLVHHASLAGTWRGGGSPPRRETPAPREPTLARLRLERDAQRRELDRMRAEREAERAWVAAEAERIRASSSWRLGHRLVRAGRLLSFRRDKGTDALGRMIERMRAPLGP